MTPKALILFSDGGSRNNPGPAAAAFILKNKDGSLIEQRGIYLGEATNNTAEYEALLAGLRTAEKFNPVSVDCFLDSELVVKQLQGIYRVKESHLLRLNEQIRSLAKLFPAVTYNYIGREKNREADKLVNQTLDALPRPKGSRSPNE
ncbi:MAG: ribonuclease HI family protein [Patescibacteria group bacterium]